MDIPNLREQFLSENLKILRCPTPRQENTPYLPILRKVLMVEERITFPVYLKVSEGEKEAIKFLPYLEEGKPCSPPGWNLYKKRESSVSISTNSTWTGWWLTSTIICF